MLIYIFATGWFWLANIQLVLLYIILLINCQTCLPHCIKELNNVSTSKPKMPGLQARVCFFFQRDAAGTTPALVNKL